MKEEEGRNNKLDNRFYIIKKRVVEIVIREHKLQAETSLV